MAATHGGPTTVATLQVAFVSGLRVILVIGLVLVALGAVFAVVLVRAKDFVRAPHPESSPTADITTVELRSELLEQLGTDAAHGASRPLICAAARSLPAAASRWSSARDDRRLVFARTGQSCKRGQRSGSCTTTAGRLTGAHGVDTGTRRTRPTTVSDANKSVSVVRLGSARLAYDS